MNTSIQDPENSSNIPEKENLNISQTYNVTGLKNLVDALGETVGKTIENLKNEREQLLKIIEVIAMELKQDFDFMAFQSLENFQKSGNVNYKIGDGDTPLIWASRKNNLEIVQLLLSRPEIQINEKNHLNMTALIQGAIYNNLEIVRLLLAHPDILVNEKEYNGMTALTWAVNNSNTEITKLLLADPRINLKEHDQGKIPLEQAKTPEIKVLIEEAMRKKGIPF